MEYNNGMNGYDDMDVNGTNNGEASDGTTPGGPEKQQNGHAIHYGSGGGLSNGLGSSPARHGRTTRSTVAAAEEAARQLTPHGHGDVGRVGGGYGMGLGAGLNINMGGEMSLGSGGDGDRTPVAEEQESHDGEGEQDGTGDDADMASTDEHSRQQSESQDGGQSQHLVQGHFRQDFVNGHSNGSRLAQDPRMGDPMRGNHGPGMSSSGHPNQQAYNSENGYGAGPISEGSGREGVMVGHANQHQAAPGQEVTLPGQGSDFGPSTASSSNSQHMSTNGQQMQHPGHYPYPYPPQPPGYGYPPYRPPHESQVSPITPSSNNYPPYPPMPQAGYMGPPGSMYPPMGYPPQPLDPMNTNVPRPMGYPYPSYGYPPHPSYGGYGQGDPHVMHPPGVVFARSQIGGMTRPKVKLTYEDKRRIVEIARSNSSLRQEDIAQQYGVDRSTISKILISSHRWTGPPQPPLQPIIKPSHSKSAGGRFPAIEQRMHEWMDAQFSAGYEIRDNVARDKAKEIARMMGFTEERFKASAKWLDKFKERRKQNGQRASVTATFESNRPNLESASDGVPMPLPTAPSAAAFAMPGYSAYYGTSGFQMADGTQSGSNSPATGPGQFLSRSQSSATLASSDSSGLDPYSMQAQQQQQHLQQHHQQMSGRMMHANRSESDMMSVQSSIAGDVGMSESGHSSRNRSRSSPQQRPNLEMTAVEPGQMDPASGRAPKVQSNANVHRHNSMHAVTSPSPRRPGGLHRTQSSTSSASNKRNHRPTSLAASAFGLTPLASPLQHDDFSPQVGHGHNPSFPHGVSHMNMHSSITSSSSSLMSSQTTTSSGGQPMTPSHPAGLFTNHVLETRVPDNQYYVPPSAGPDHAQYVYAYGNNGGYGSHPPSATIEQKSDGGWRREE